MSAAMVLLSATLRWLLSRAGIVCLMRQVTITERTEIKQRGWSIPPPPNYLINHSVMLFNQLISPVKTRSGCPDLLDDRTACGS